MSETGCVYLLIDPRNNAVKYVGASKQPDTRYQQHLNARMNQGMREWVKELEAQDMTPEMAVVASTDLRDLDEVEEYWTELMLKHYDLLNKNTNISYNYEKVKASVNRTEAGRNV